MRKCTVPQHAGTPGARWQSPSRGATFKTSGRAVPGPHRTCAARRVSSQPHVVVALRKHDLNGQLPCADERSRSDTAGLSASGVLLYQRRRLTAVLEVKTPVKTARVDLAPCGMERSGGEGKDNDLDDRGHQSGKLPISCREVAGGRRVAASPHDRCRATRRMPCDESSLLLTARCPSSPRPGRACRWARHGAAAFR